MTDVAPGSAGAGNGGSVPARRSAVDVIAVMILGTPALPAFPRRYVVAPADVGRPDEGDR